MIRIEFIGRDTFGIKLQQTGGTIVAAVKRSILQSVMQLHRYIVSVKLQGNPLNYRTGNLTRATYFTQPIDNNGVISATVETSSELAPYGFVHEYGGTFSIREHLRRGPSGGMFTVREHMATFPERSYLRAGLQDIQDVFGSNMSTEIQKALDTL